MPGTDGSTKGENIVKYVVVAAVLIMFIWAARAVVGGFLTSMPTASLALSSVLLLLGTLLIFGMAVNAAGLSDKTQALGLPEGSVRAILALALVGLFAIMASSVLQGTESHQRKDLTLAEVNEMKARFPDALSFDVKPQPQPGTPGGPYTLTFDTPKKIDEFAKQVLTVIGTLMTAVVAFYFGSAASRAPADVSRASPVLTTVINATREPLKHGERLTLDVTGSSLNSVRQLRLSKPGLELEAEGVLSNATNLTGSFAANEAFETPGKWTVSVVDDIGRSASKPDGLTVVQKPVPAAAPPH